MLNKAKKQENQLKLTSADIAVYNSYVTPPLTVGPSTGAHLEASGNRILSKANETAGSVLYLNYGSGKDVYCTDMWLCQEINTCKAIYTKLMVLILHQLLVVVYGE